MDRKSGLEYETLELARFAVELGLLDRPRNFGKGYDCSLCGYRPPEDREWGATIRHWTECHHPLDLIMRAADKKEDQTCLEEEKNLTA